MAEANDSKPAARAGLSSTASTTGTKTTHGQLATGITVDLTAVAAPMATFNVREQSYIPTALARKTIDSMHSDMIAMRKRHVEKLTEVAQFFQSVEDTTKRNVLSFLEVFRATAHNELASHKRALQQANLQLREQHEQSAERIAALEDVIRSHERSASEASDLAQLNMASAANRHSDVSA